MTQADAQRVCGDAGLASELYARAAAQYEKAGEGNLAAVQAKVTAHIHQGGEDKLKTALHIAEEEVSLLALLGREFCIQTCQLIWRTLSSPQLGKEHAMVGEALGHLAKFYHREREDSLNAEVRTNLHLRRVV